MAFVPICVLNLILLLVMFPSGLQPVVPALQSNCMLLNHALLLVLVAEEEYRGMWSAWVVPEFGGGREHEDGILVPAWGARQFVVESWGGLALRFLRFQFC